nr:hypothetical protein [Oligoflexales bacterium]
MRTNKFLTSKSSLTRGLLLVLLASSNLSSAETDFSVDPESLSWNSATADVSSEELMGRTIYTLTSDANLRDGFPATSLVRIHEEHNNLFLRSGHKLFDALFALSVQEAKENSVAKISDWAFADADCACFETGRKWNYVWTRDTAYAVDLGLAIFDAPRSRNSLDFKLSKFRDSPLEQIVQDTGSGGSWPISTDRVVWALGADATLKNLPEIEQLDYKKRIFSALVNTLETDRSTVYDARDGLYRGEQSFLDWREQSYASWTANNVAEIAASKALSTNALHYNALRTAAKYAADLNDKEKAKKYSQWAKDLKEAINFSFWSQEHGMYKSIITSDLNPAALSKFDLLGLALTILFDIADEEKSLSILSKYPHSEAGAAVIWPQQPFTPIYHNRAIWPFVSAYWIKAAKKMQHIAALDHNLLTLIKGSSLNLSNMENFEFLTLENWFSDNEFSGPVINSQRQLWSVAGYLSGVIDGLFGLEREENALRFQPLISAKMRQLFLAKNEIKLSNLNLQGKLLNVTLRFNESESLDSNDYFVVENSFINGKKIAGDKWLQFAELAPTNEIVLELKKQSNPNPASIHKIEVANPYSLSFQEVKKLWSPKEPAFESMIQINDSDIELKFNARGEPEVLFNIYRNGQKIAEQFSGQSWIDRGVIKNNETQCYSIESEYTETKNRSHHSQTLCWWGQG